MSPPVPLLAQRLNFHARKKLAQCTVKNIKWFNISISRLIMVSKYLFTRLNLACQPEIHNNQTLQPVQLKGHQIQELGLSLAFHLIALAILPWVYKKVFALFSLPVYVHCQRIRKNITPLNSQHINLHLLDITIIFNISHIKQIKYNF